MMEKIMMKLKDTEIRKRMASFAFIAFIFIVLLGSVAFVALGKLKIGSKTYDEIILSKDLTADILPPPEYIIESYLTSIEYMLESNEDARKEKLAYIDGLKGEYDQRHEYWIECQNNGKINDEISEAFITDSYEAAQEFYDVFYNQMVSAVEAGDSNKINEAYIELNQAYTKHREAIDQVVELAGVWASETEEKADMQSVLYYLLVVSIMLASIICGYIYSKFLSHSVISEVDSINTIMDKVSKGDLSVLVDEEVKTKDEFGQLALCIELTLKRLNSYSAYINEIANVLEKMANGCMKVEVKFGYEGEFAIVKQALIKISESLHCTLSQINISADKVSADSQNVADLSAKLSQGTSNQASIIEELLASVEQIDTLVKDNVKGAVDANSKVKDVTKVIQSGNDEMIQLLSAMSDIKEASSKIEEIANTIAEISSRTNLLALNASIEAARAGEQGRGFAIVANEVGALAQQSAASATITTNLIKETMEVVNKGVTLADNTANSLNKVVEGAIEISNIMNEIENASKTQSEAISQMALGIEEIASVVDNNVQSVSISANASSNLNDEVKVLKKLVNHFEL